MRNNAIKHALLNSAALATGAGLLASLFANSATANPLGAAVTTGSASVTASYGKTRIDQKSEDVVIDWSSFNIGAGQTTQFVQPNAQAIAVNRIGGNAPSQILGTLDANGRIVLINDNGMLFGKGAAVNVGALIATSTGGSDSDVLSGKFTQAGNQNASVINQGSIRTSQGGLVALVAPSVTNTGTVNAKFGTVAFGAANKFTVDFTGDGLVSFAVQGDVNTRASVANTGTLNGANVSLTAQAAEGVATGVVNVGGFLIAQGVNATGGTIMLDAGNGVLISTGSLDAGGKTGGGTIETSGEQVSISGHVTAGPGGSWKVDPYDLTVNAAAATTIDGSLNSGTNVSLQTTATGTSGPGTSSASGNGDIFIDSPISWGTTATLSLSAYRNIDFNASVVASGGGSVSLVTGTGGSGNYSFGLCPNGFAGSLQFTGGSSSGSTLTINGTPYTLLYSISDVQNINNNLSGNYALANSIDASSVTNWVPIGTDGAGNIENSEQGFIGTFDGLGNTISKLSVNLQSFDYIGLIGVASGSATVRNLGLLDESITGFSGVGGLIGENTGTIEQSYVTGVVTGTTETGGLTGANYGETIAQSYSTTAVNGTTDPDPFAGNGNYVAFIGGLVGENSGTIEQSYATGAVSSAGTVAGVGLGDFTGGLVGRNIGGTILQSHATGAVTSVADYIGGLAGYNFGGLIEESYATGGVSGQDGVGGLTGLNDASSVITRSYATGAVNGSSSVGGLVGENDGAVSQSYATGAVSGSEFVGGFAGLNSNTGTIADSDWDTQTSGSNAGIGTDNNNQSGNVTGLTTAQLSSALPSGFNTAVWGNVNNQATPYLISNPGPVYIGSDSTDIFTLVFTMAQLQAINTNLNSNYALANSLNAATDPSTPESWIPIGTDGNANVLNSGNGFAGIFDGLGNTISNLTINLPSSDYVGLFGYSSGTLRNIGIVGGSVIGNDIVGGLVASNSGSISNAYSADATSGEDVSGYVGGLVADNSGSITDSYATGPVSSAMFGSTLGGLVSTNNGTITDSYSTSTIISGFSNHSGGLVGYNSGIIDSSFATRQVSSSGLGSDLGGLVGINDVGGTISASYATGAVSVGTTLGGLVGFNNGSITDSYAAGEVTGAV